MVISKKTIIKPQFSKVTGAHYFIGGGVQHFPGGVQLLIPIETYRTCDFSVSVCVRGRGVWPT